MTWRSRVSILEDRLYACAGNTAYILAPQTPPGGSLVHWTTFNITKMQPQLEKFI